MASPSALPPALQSVLSDLDDRLNGMESAMRSLSAMDQVDAEQLPPLEKAHLNATLAYTSSALYFMYLRTQGVTPKEHPVQQELTRVQEYFKKIDRVEHPEKYKKPKTLVPDKAAIQRLVKGALNSKAGKAKGPAPARARARGRRG